MKAIIRYVVRFVLVWLMSVGFLAPQPAEASQSNISPTDKHAWSEGAGWMDFGTDHSSVIVHSSYLSGHAWCRNIGWISLGNSSGKPYQNTGADDWGVNIDTEGNLSGYAWSDVAGWISFSTPHSQVTMDTEGRFDGYAWSQNIGWIHFRNAAPAYNLRRINIAPTLASSNPELAGLTDDDTDNAGASVSEILAESVTDVGDGALEGIAVYDTEPGNGEWQYSPDDGVRWNPLGTVSQSSTLLLASDDKIRFVPDGIGADSASISFYAWDQTFGSPGETADVSARGDTTAFSTAGDTASATVTLVIDVSGQVTYHSSGEPLSEMLLTLEAEDGSAYTAYTDQDGYYTLSDIPPGDYTLAPSGTDPGPDTLTATDASEIARHVAKLLTFDEWQQLAADVNQNDKISGMDASDLARYATELIPEMNEDGIHWAFTQTPIRYSRLDSDRENQDFDAVRLGDVSGNYSSGREVRASRGERGSETEIRAAPGDRLSIPVVINSEDGIAGIDIRIEFDAVMLTVSDVTLADGVLEHEPYALVANTRDPGRMTLAIFGTGWNLFSGSGTVLHVSFDVIGAKPGILAEFTNFLCNEIPVSGAREKGREAFGGFYMNGGLFQRIRLRAEYDLARHDLDGDGRISLTDAVFALQQGDLEGAIRALQAVAGF
ncbi:carboxypeptidase regulatory-like domain-containing protein [Desulfobacterales bacterium HSG2]|nr:carboxypeptidase regulatory-like domain-containing protein [Desulfobacterales bacterium HSG2]